MSRIADPDQPARVARARTLLQAGVTTKNVNFTLQAEFGKGIGHSLMKQLYQEVKAKTRASTD